LSEKDEDFKTGPRGNKSRKWGEGRLMEKTEDGEVKVIAENVDLMETVEE